MVNPYGAGEPGAAGRSAPHLRVLGLGLDALVRSAPCPLIVTRGCTKRARRRHARRPRPRRESGGPPELHGRAGNHVPGVGGPVPMATRAWASEHALTSIQEAACTARSWSDTTAATRGDALALAGILRADDGAVIAACVYPTTGPGRGRQLEGVMADAAAGGGGARASKSRRTGSSCVPSGATPRPMGCTISSRGEQADLVVVGSAHRGRIRQLLVSSTGERLLNGAPCPVAVAPKGYAAAAALPAGIGAGLRTAAATLEPRCTCGGAGTRAGCRPQGHQRSGAPRRVHRRGPVRTTPGRRGDLRYRRELLARVVQEAVEPLPSDLPVTTALVEGHAADQIPPRPTRASTCW